MTQLEKRIVIKFMERMQAHVAQFGDDEDSVKQNKIDINAWDNLARIVGVRKFSECKNFGELK